MLVLSRKLNEKVVINCDGRLIKLTVVGVRGDRVRLGWEADRDIAIHRDEVFRAIEREREARDESQAEKSPVSP